MINYSLMFVFAWSTFVGANSAFAQMNINCVANEVGAEVLANGKISGERPMDIIVQKERVDLVRNDAAMPIAQSAAKINVALARDETQTSFRDCADCPEMVVIPPGSFVMGSNSGNANEMPVHSVTISHAFALGKTEITQAQWKALMGSNPSGFSNCGDNCPVENVSWDDVQEFILKLNAKTGKQYRLPSEAEWEYAARAGSTTAFPWGDQASHEHANYGEGECCKGLAQGRDQWVNTSPVGSFPANAFGLYDMIGNVWEWTEDSYHNNYVGAPADGSAWQGDGVNRVLRGGSWYFKSQNARTAYRGRNVPTYRYYNFGFRLVRILE